MHSFTKAIAIRFKLNFLKQIILNIWVFFFSLLLSMHVRYGVHICNKKNLKKTYVCAGGN